MFDSLQSYGLYPYRFLCPWDFSKQEYWSGLPFPFPGSLPNPGIKPMSPALQVDSLPLSHWASPYTTHHELHAYIFHSSKCFSCSAWKLFLHLVCLYFLFFSSYNTTYKFKILYILSSPDHVYFPPLHSNKGLIYY